MALHGERQQRRLGVVGQITCPEHAIDDLDRELWAPLRDMQRCQRKAGIFVMIEARQRHRRLLEPALSHAQVGQSAHRRFPDRAVGEQLERTGQLDLGV